jgi:PIN domain nuclease of toxin-antitoxin system
LGNPEVILLDTHTLLWWQQVEPSRLSARAVETLANANFTGALKISTITTWEVAMLVEKGRIRLDTDPLTWMDRLAELFLVEFIPIDNRIAVEANRLPDPFHRDPADRIIVATARVFGMPLLTADDRILAYDHVEAVW